MPINISQSITKEDIYTERCFDIKWLKKQGFRPFLKSAKLTSGVIKASLLNRLTPTTSNWNGYNTSGWKSDILAVNGFDERMQSGGEDGKLGEQLETLGLKPKQLSYSAICLHLDHPSES